MRSRIRPGRRDRHHPGGKRLELGVELFGNSPKERGGRSDFAFNLGGTWKLSNHVNLLFAGGRDIVGDTKCMVYLGLQVLTK